MSYFSDYKDYDGTKLDRLIASFERHKFQRENGTYFSDSEEYKELLQEVEEAKQDLLNEIESLKEAVDDDSVLDLIGFEVSAEAFHRARENLKYALPCSDVDYIIGGTIDPHDVADRLDKSEPIARRSWGGWNCEEGAMLYDGGDGFMYFRWYRDSGFLGGLGWAYKERTPRDLWVRVTF